MSTEPILINNKDQLLAIIIPAAYRSEGIQFFTPDDYSQQLAFMCHPAGKEIAPHVHNVVKRDVHLTQEVLVIRTGRLRVDFFDDGQNYLFSHILAAGDVILLSGGGHGFEVLEEVEMYEIKQGPYLGEADKTRFKGEIGEVRWL
jgi:mannose-6-phosphate isomerase-like protein (cupin superfamily)